MTAYIVYSLSEEKSLFASDSFERAKDVANRLSAAGWSFAKGRHFCPVVILDVWVHDKDCGCSGFCGGSPEDA